ncbi:hypothetical protein OG379_07085 [Streptomyces sp. NBC_01166]|uniref:hypothetical protein n=1 Tax=Streptomyces sp. NBC_01166 TaxID=2903755 RepID=UPI00386E48C0|nr:hypothetical protein OG379_07085 [Streptomyces sp. NBC_01166]
MIEVMFSVRAGQGDPSGFDLGDIFIEGEYGSMGSGGHVPDQGMMIHPSVTLLLDSLRTLFAGEKKQISFTGADTSFRLDFKRDRRGLVSVSQDGILLGRSSLEDLSCATLRAAQNFSEDYLSALPAEDAVRSDYLSALRDLHMAMTREQQRHG